MEDLNLIQYTIFAVIIYLIIKQDDQSYIANGKEKCRNCGMKIDTNSLNCPYCQEEIKKRCERCGKSIDIDWRYCPFCEDNEQIV